ncbi:ribonucleoside-diphosphate reductase subunit alpha [Nakamurella flavida]|uniref:Ribonucleoside-diphosphate reductase n=1 Tax=Nakamurella flavida TaxID=363630 RepID=A0A939C0M2_9ACTN|nr:ribonucleoside-diphosphate reductase subunit alpha [Nakamurella flavida]MBM9476863.1 ribonucleoside-diphosphate reductase subunit alpha [Nakamurella flavida]MDP9779807.1 ribonucleoside-diphosphate reductase alpha chain [Nakamurella flavida]
MTQTFTPTTPRPAGTTDEPAQPGSGAPHGMTVLRRTGTTAPFDAGRISVALTKAFLAVEGESAGRSSRLRAQVIELTDAVTATLARRYGADSGSAPGRPIDLEEVQDQVELALMRSGDAAVARAYILYREEHRRARSEASELPAGESVTGAAGFQVLGLDGTCTPLDLARLEALVTEACDGLPDTDAATVLAATRDNLYDGITTRELGLAPIMAARALVETEPAYTTVAARLLNDTMRAEALSFLSGRPEQADAGEMAERYAPYFRAFVARGIECGQLDPTLAEFDLDRLGDALLPERDGQFTFLGLQTLYDRYFLHSDGTRYELPQAFFMRVAMGLAVREIDREARAIEFYRLLSSFDFMASTPTLFNAGTTRPQLSSCFLTTVDDDLDDIFQSIKNNALLAKFSGGLGNDWTPVRGIGAHIKGTNGLSSGVVPFLKIANDTAVAVNQGGKRKGAVCAYLETWHVDIEEFLDLRRNTGDERRRTHDMNTANWIPDEFMRRVESGASWTLFSPDEVPDLHDLVGTAFSERYAEYEAAADRGEMRVFRRVAALDLWRKMLTSLFETGHPWITFKDPCNLRSPQQHVGVVHSSNLCTEITLNTRSGAEAETAVCNLGSVNLAAHVTADGLDVERLRRTVTTAVRMLDNVIDINMYTVPSARRSNLRHRPIGLGLMGFADALYAQGIAYASDAAVEFADTSMEQLSYFAIAASSDLAAERGRYGSFEGSLWSRGILPIDSVEILADSRGGDLDQDRTQRLDWDALRQRVISQGMRNSNVMAIAPTATISNIIGVAQSIEPTYRNLFVKSNMSGDFTVVNAALVAVLKERGLWDEVMVADLKYFDGSLWPIDRIPDDVKQLFATAFEIDGSWLVRAASRRQKWIDQAQSLNLYVAAPNGRKLDEIYRLAWRTGCKTTYYLRSTSATHVEKSTLRGTDGRLNAVSATPVAAPAPVAVVPVPAPVAAPIAQERPVRSEAELAEAEALACSIENPDCEACQ